MSRRDSRAHLAVRQNDALLEFENFKRKYLLVNKHITKLNSTLSVRIEELNAQISELYVENLRLRSSEISLAAQLYREKEKSRRLMHEAESAATGLATRFTNLREAYAIPSGVDALPTAVSEPLRARKPLRTGNGSTPPRARVSRAPDVPHISEVPSDVEESPERPGSRLDSYHSYGHQQQEEPQRPRASSSSGKSIRRQSGLVAALMQQPTEPEPEAEEEEMDIVDASPSPPIASTSTSTSAPPLLVQPTPVLRKARRLSGPTPSPARAEAQDREEEEEVRREMERAERKKEVERAERRAKKEQRERERQIQHPQPQPTQEQTLAPKRAPFAELNDAAQVQVGLRDVTNAKGKIPTIATATTTTTATKIPHLHVSVPAAVERVPTPEPMDLVMPMPANGNGMGMGVGMGDDAGGRERRARKSVNYAEPKLNTKMRKPDPPEGSTVPASGPTRRKKSSTSGNGSRKTSTSTSTSTLAVADEAAADGYADGEGFFTPRPPGATYVRRHTIAAA